MRFHIVSLPHTQTTLEYTSCAFTEKVRRFVIMMNMLGHETFLYSGDENTTECTEHISCIPEEMRIQSLNGNHYTQGSFDSNLPHWQYFNGRVIEEINKRVFYKDDDGNYFPLSIKWKDSNTLNLHN